ncbi:cytochrome P450 [Abortiporus biennis]|nr:cytochrome P450 [Abortiporus biennis]
MASETTHRMTTVSAQHIIPHLFTMFVATIVLVAIWTLASWIYNIYLHPLAKFPGPKLAAMTKLWRAHLELVQQGSLYEKLSQLHSVYGDVIRIGPNELHFSRPSAYDDIYNARNKWCKESDMYLGMSVTHKISTISTCEYSQAKKKKDLLTPFFSRRSILDLQSIVQEKMEEVCAVLTDRHKSGQTSNIRGVVRSFVLDTITSISFAQSFGAIQAPDFKLSALLSMDIAMPIYRLFFNFPVTRSVLNLFPFWFVELVGGEGLRGFSQMRKRVMNQIESILANEDLLNAATHQTIYHDLIPLCLGRRGKDGNTTGHLDKYDLFEEAWLLIFAGTDTTGNALTVGMVNVIDNPQIYGKLRAELEKAWPSLSGGAPKYEELEKLDYLKAVVKESLRLSHGVVIPQRRIVPSQGARISDHFIPGNTIIGVSNQFVHLSPILFPNPHQFLPERWLKQSPSTMTVSEGYNEELADADIVAFSKGPRSCLGIKRFDIKFDKDLGAKDLIFEEALTAHFVGPDLDVIATPVPYIQ